VYKCTRLPSLASEDFSCTCRFPHHGTQLPPSSPPPHLSSATGTDPHADDTADLVIWTSIESNTLIIASCIPILQPLVDRLRGKRSRAATPSAGRFSPYPPGGGARPRTLNPQSAYEMSFACRGAGRTRRDLESVTEIEADAKAEDAVSQDSTLVSGSPRSQGGSSSGGGGGGGGNGGGPTGYHYHHGHQAPTRPPEEGIMRTNVITISYDERRPDSSCSELQAHPAQWRPKNGY